MKQIYSTPDAKQISIWPRTVVALSEESFEKYEWDEFQF